MIEGPWLHTILFEIPVLAIVNEVYFRNTQRKPDLREGRDRLRDKIQLLGATPGILRLQDRRLRHAPPLLRSNGTKR